MTGLGEDKRASLSETLVELTVLWRSGLALRPSHTARFGKNARPEKMFRYLPSGSCGTPLGIVGALPQGARQRNPRSNLRAMRHLRLDRQVAPHQSQALAHAD